MSFNIYYSMDDILVRLTGKTDVRTDCGWGRLVDIVRKLLVDSGYSLVNSPEEADLELFVGQPPLYLEPQLHPAIILTMYESTILPKLWVDSINKWDIVINPSNWGSKTFKDSGVTTNIEVVPLPIDIEKFGYVERDYNETWNFITQSVQLTDRKNVILVKDVFDIGMPDDTFLTIKTLPKHNQPQFDEFIHEQLRLVQCSLPFNEYFDLLTESHVSVNPSAAEGFGYLPCLASDTIVYANNTIKRIDNICIGDLVLTHKGNWKKVSAINVNECKEDIIEIKVNGTYKPIKLTPDHIVPVYRPNGKRKLYEQFNPSQLFLFGDNIMWVKASDITTSDLLVQPRFVSNISNSKKYFDVTEFVDGILYDDSEVWFKMSYSINPEWSYRRLIEVTGIKYSALQTFIQGKRCMSNTYRNSIQGKLDKIGYTKPQPIKYKRFWLLDEELAYILGIYTAEGSYSNGAMEFSIHANEEDFAQSIKQCLSTYIDCDPLDMTIPNTYSRRIIYSSKLIGKFFSNCCGLGAHNKKIPLFIMDADINVQKQFLRGLFEGDAHSNNRKYDSSKNTILCTVSKVLAYQVKLLLLKLGLNAQITKGKQRGFVSYYIGVGGKQLAGSYFLDIEWSTDFPRQHFFFY